MKGKRGGRRGKSQHFSFLPPQLPSFTQLNDRITGDNEKTEHF
jgi:hypothetical protein